MGVGVAGADPKAGGPARRRLVGRDQELERLFGMVDQIAEHGGALVVRGEAGIGKSALLEAAGERARERGATVVTTTGTQSEARLAFGGLHQLLLPFLDRVSHRPDPQRKALDVAFGVTEGDAPDLFLVGLAALGVVTEREAQTPLLLVVEDAHWLDRSSAEVLAFVARRLEMEPVILLFAVRDGVPSVLDEAGLPDLTLVGLDDDASRTLLEVNEAGLSEDLKGRILAEAAGNPLALIELPAAVNLELARAWEPLPLTARLEATFATRLTALDADVRALVLLAALDDGKLAELNHAAEELLGARFDADNWTVAAAAGLGTLDDGEFRFRHPLIRSAVYQAATGEQRRSAHAALARTLAGNPDRAVWHRAAAAQGPDEEVASALDAAADRARYRGGLDIAFAALERAAGLSADPRLRALRLARAGNLANQLGRSVEAVRLLRAALQLGRLPAHEAARASFDLETLTRAWSGASTIRRFARIAEDLADRGDGRGALEALAAVSVRAYWDQLDDERGNTCRRSSSGSPYRLTTHSVWPLSGSSIRFTEARRSSVGSRRCPRTTCPARTSRWPSVGPRWRSGPTTSPSRSFAPRWRDTGPTAGWRGSPRASSTKPGQKSTAARSATRSPVRQRRQGSPRKPASSTTGVARISPSQSRPPSGARRKRPISSSPMPRRRWCRWAPTLSSPWSPSPVAGRLSLLSGQARRITISSACTITRTLSHEPYVCGWALADLVDSAVSGDGDLDLVRGVLNEWEAVAASTGAPHLQVQLSYAAGLLAGSESAEQLFQVAITSAAAGWPFYAARTQLAYGGWLRRQRRGADSRTAAARGRSDFRRPRSAPLRRPCAPRAARFRRARAPSRSRGVGGVEPARASDRAAGGRGSLEPRHRRAAVSLPPNGEHAPAPALPEARDHLAHPAPRRSPAAARLVTHHRHVTYATARTDR